MNCRLLLVLVVATLPACTGEGTAVVARLTRVGGSTPDAGQWSDSGSDAGTETAADAGPSLGWPEGTMWSLYEEPGGSADWITPPTSSSVSVDARSPQNVRAGLAFEFPGGSLLDLAQYDQVGLTIDVSVGETFELFLGRGPNEGCSYVFARGQASSYSTSLSAPAWCVPTQCGFDLKVKGGLVLAYVPTDSRLVATVTGLSFFTSRVGARSGSASALGGAKGPGGFCWFLVNWEKSPNVDWVLTNPTSSSVHVRATTSTNSVVGMAFEIPQGFRLSQYRTLVVDATVSGAATQSSTTFLIQAVRLGQGRGWVLHGDGKRQSYRIDLNQPAYYFNGAGDGGHLSLDDVQRIEFVPQSGGGESTIDALVQAIEFQP